MNAGRYEAGPIEFCRHIHCWTCHGSSFGGVRERCKGGEAPCVQLRNVLVRGDETNNIGSCRGICRGGNKRRGNSKEMGVKAKEFLLNLALADIKKGVPF